ncbi:hypothetical protein SynPROS91_01408 [Synechococcus sp. PROS-9-1]|nr:hypothetical protein SynPROS91_01408 [Synechococcus sp. PROS-9-1]
MYKQHLNEVVVISKIQTVLSVQQPSVQQPSVQQPSLQRPSLHNYQFSVLGSKS